MRGIGALLAAWIALGALSCPAAEKLTPLAEPPNWPALAQLEESALSRGYTRREFTRLINTVYSPDGGFWRYCKITDKGVTVFADKRKTRQLLKVDFIEPRKNDSHNHGPQCGCGPSPDKPLEPYKICLDPGHIGGRWAKLEERYFAPDPKRPIIEAELTLTTCRLIEKKLQALGAEVVWTKKDFEPVTTLRPADLKQQALESLRDPNYRTVTPPPGNTISLQEYRASALFYRNAEIFARAKKVGKFEPDLTLCVHYNAAPWRSFGDFRFVDSSRLVVYVNGAYTANELEYEDQKFCLLSKILRGDYAVELGVANAIAQQMEKKFGHPPELTSPTARRVGPHPYVCARNLLANRAFPCPVVFVEGPYMNARDTYARLQAGHYEGKRKINGKWQRSIHEEMAQAIVNGVAAYFSTNKYH